MNYVQVILSESVIYFDSFSDTEKKNILEFIDSIAYWQHHAAIDAEKFKNQFHSLPSSLQVLFKYKGSKPIFRGIEIYEDSQLEDEKVSSFTYSKHTAEFFAGNSGKVLSNKDIASYSFGIDIPKTAQFTYNRRNEKTMDKFNETFKWNGFDISIGDDEDEVLMFGVKWKK